MGEGRRYGGDEDRRPRRDVSTNSPLKKGVRGLFVNEHGELAAETELGAVKFTKPVAYQEIDGKRVAVEYRIQVSSGEGTEVRGAEGQGSRGSPKLASCSQAPQTGS